MMQPRAIDLALDLARMPALARAPVVPPIPANVIEIMQIAAASPKACEEAAAATGEPAHVLVEASRFYLQQLLFRPDSDSYRVLGLRPGASRAAARKHMRWLMQWLHPDRSSGLEEVYAARVLKAWRLVSDMKSLAVSGDAAAAKDLKSDPTLVSPPVDRTTGERSTKRFTCGDQMGAARRPDPGLSRVLGGVLLHRIGPDDRHVARAIIALFGQAAALVHAGI